MGFKTPKQLATQEEEPKVPISGRIREGARDRLEAAAKKDGKSLSWLVGKVLEDYDEWLQKQKPTSR